MVKAIACSDASLELIGDGQLASSWPCPPRLFRLAKCPNRFVLCFGRVNVVCGELRRDLGACFEMWNGDGGMKRENEVCGCLKKQQFGRHAHALEKQQQ